MAIMVYTESDYKYQLLEDYGIMTPFKGWGISTDWASLSPDGMLRAKKGYAWDGASGPTYDSEYSMMPAGEHDMFYAFLRAKLLPELYRKKVDAWFRKRLIICGLHYVKKYIKGSFKRYSARQGVRVRAWGWYRSVRSLGGSSAAPKKVKSIRLEYPDV